MGATTYLELRHNRHGGAPTVVRVTEERVELSDVALAIYRRCLEKGWKNYSVDYLDPGRPYSPDNMPDWFNGDAVGELMIAGLLGPMIPGPGFVEWAVTPAVQE